MVASPHPPNLRQKPGSLKQSPYGLFFLPVVDPTDVLVQQAQDKIRTCLHYSWGPISHPDCFQTSHS